jgi:hypothetical protein
MIDNPGIAALLTSTLYSGQAFIGLMVKATLAH